MSEPTEFPSSAPPGRVAAGSLLVASPRLADPNFRRAVIYVIDHRTGEDEGSEGGTTGVILGRPSAVQVLDVLPRWREVVSGPRTLFVGGPVQSNAALCLVRTVPDRAPEGYRPVAAGIGMADLDGDPSMALRSASAIRIFAGYAGWGATQLAGEIAAGAWLVLPGRPADVFADPGTDLWRTVIARQGEPVSWIASFPDDPTLN